MTRTVTTGVQGLDAHFGGGIPSGSTILALAEPSNAPYLFAEQFAAGGLGNGEMVYYYSLERPKDEVLERIAKVLDKPAAMKGLQFIDCYSVRLRNMPHEMLKYLGVENHSPKIVDDLLARLHKHPKNTPFRIVVESLTESIQAYGLEPTMNLVYGIVGTVKAMDGNALLGLVRGIHGPQVEIQLRHAADGVVEFGIDRQGFGLYSYLSVTKMRGVQDATRLLLYKETDKGLWLESTRRVF